MFHCKFLALLFMFFRISLFFAATIPPSFPPSPSQSFSTASQQFASLHTPPLYLLSNRGRLHAYRMSCFCRHPLVVPFLLLSGDIELNPGPSVPFIVCTLNVRSLINYTHSIAVSDIADSFHPDIFCLTETWIKPTTTSVELDCVPGYSLISYPCTSSSNKSSWNVGGGTAFLVKEPFSQLPSTISTLSLIHISEPTRPY